jgi:hypothetical protein
MRCAKIMLIRHTERPSADKSTRGVTQAGVKDKEELTVRGWQRAGALVPFFAPRDNHFVNPALARPAILFACKAGPTAPGNTTSAPQYWPLDRFDLVWVFDRLDGNWTFTQVPQLLLAGDRPDVID